MDQIDRTTAEAIYVSSLTYNGSVIEEPFRDITDEYTYMCVTDKYTIIDGEGRHDNQFIVEFTVETIFGEISLKSFTSKHNWRKNPSDLNNHPLQIVFKRISNDAKVAQIYIITELIGGTENDSK